MIPILSNSEIRQLDALTIRSEPIASIDLMERASRAFCRALVKRCHFQTVVIFCGPGNNGGDGLAIARILSDIGKEVIIVVPPRSAKKSQDHLVNLERLKKKDVAIFEITELSELTSSELIIDGLFGSGLDRGLEGEYLKAVHWINEQNCSVISIDIPSGMTDGPEEVKLAVEADHTIGFQYPKWSMLMPTARKYCESFELVDIGLLSFEGKSNAFLVDRRDIAAMLPVHSKFTHKYERGGVLLVGGSKGMAGSIVLSAEASLRSGAGLVHALVDEEVVVIGTTKMPEVMFHTNAHTKLHEVEAKVKAIGIGPGLGRESSKVKVLKDVLSLDKNIVLDADAIRIAAEEGLDVRGCVLTPHEGEFKALVGSWESEMDKLQKLRNYCTDNDCVVVLKGAHTLVCDGSVIYVNPIGDPAMATAGSGDVLLGVISSLLAQRCSKVEAAICGVYTHAFAAVRYLNEKQSTTLISSDIARYLGSAMKDLKQDTVLVT